MNREFLLNIIFLVFVNLLIKPFYIFGIDRSIQNLVGEREYGIYYSLVSFTVLFQIINDLGIQNFNSREIAQNRQLLNKYLPNVLVLKIILALIYIGFILLFFIFFQYDLRLLPLVFYLSLSQIMFALMGYLRSNIAGLGMYKTNSFLTILDKLLLIGVCAVLIWVEPFRSQFDLIWLAHAQNFTLLITCLVALSVIFSKVKKVRFTFNLPFLILLLKKSFPYALAIFLMTIYTRTDVVMMERMLPDGDRQAGIYASAYRLLDAVNMLGVLFAGLLLPMFARQLKAGENITPLLRLSFQIIWIGSVTLGVGVWFHRAAIMQLLYHEATPFSGDVLGVLMCSFVAISGTYIYSTLLGANGNIQKMNTIFLIAFMLNVLLNFLFIPSQKALGAAFSTCITQIFVMLGMMFLTQKELRPNILRGGKIWIAKLVGWALGAILIHYLIMWIDWGGSWLYQISFATLLTIALALILGLLNYKKLEYLVK